MKVSDHVRKLLIAGHKPRELVGLGFSKTVVTRLKRQLKKERTVSAIKAPAQPVGAEQRTQGTVSAPENLTEFRQRLESLESTIRAVVARVEAAEQLSAELDDLKNRLIGTPALGLRQQFTCSCGASGLVALYIKCTKCDRETWRGWFPD